MSILIDLRYSLVQYVTPKNILIVHFSKDVTKIEDLPGLNKMLSETPSSTMFYMQKCSNMVAHGCDKISIDETTV